MGEHAAVLGCVSLLSPFLSFFPLIFLFFPWAWPGFSFLFFACAPVTRVSPTGPGRSTKQQQLLFPLRLLSLPGPAPLFFFLFVHYFFCFCFFFSLSLSLARALQPTQEQGCDSNRAPLITPLPLFSALIRGILKGEVLPFLSRR